MLCITYILQVLFDRLPMIGHVITAGFFAAPATFQIVGGVDGSASWASIVFSNLLEPSFITNRLDSFKTGPELYPMRHFRLKQFQIIAGICFTFAFFIRLTNVVSFSLHGNPHPRLVAHAHRLFAIFLSIFQCIIHYIRLLPWPPSAQIVTVARSPSHRTRLAGS
jgi:hypothetical protein